MVRRTCVFASGGICESCSVVQCVQGVKHRRTIFYARVGPVCFHKNHVRTRCDEVVFLHLVGSMGHIVHSVASRA
jgi:hypothetical protein